MPPLPKTYFLAILSSLYFLAFANAHYTHPHKYYPPPIQTPSKQALTDKISQRFSKNLMLHYQSYQALLLAHKKNPQIDLSPATQQHHQYLDLARTINQKIKNTQNHIIRTREVAILDLRYDVDYLEKLHNKFQKAFSSEYSSFLTSVEIPFDKNQLLELD